MKSSHIYSDEVSFLNLGSFSEFWDWDEQSQSQSEAPKNCSKEGRHILYQGKEAHGSPAESSVFPERHLSRSL